MMNFNGSVRLWCLVAVASAAQSRPAGGRWLALATVATVVSTSLTIDTISEPCLVGIRAAGRDQHGRRAWAVGREGADIAVGFNQADAAQARRYFCSYLGLAFAKPPVGRRRFEPPQLAAPEWRGRKHFTAEASPCLQLGGWKIGDSTIVGSEDCLYLNVHTTNIRRFAQTTPATGNPSPSPPDQPPSNDPPSTGGTNLRTTADVHALDNPPLPSSHRDNGSRISSINLTKTSAKTQIDSNPSATVAPAMAAAATRLKPVLVWLHGGSFNVGSASSDTNGTDYIVAKDVLVVTVNYRLGALGFMALPAANITGNYGLQDQQMALTWCRRYIRSFGGDPNRITLMGWSAGAASVGMHMFAESSRGLFKRAIMMSGSPINPWAFNAAATKCTDALLAQLRVEHADDDDGPGLKRTLQQLDTHAFVRNVVQHTPFRVFGNLEFCFVPTVDADLSPSTPEHSLATSSAVNAVPLLIGSTSLEMESDFPQGFEWENAYLPNNDTALVRLIDDYLRAQLKAPFDGGDSRETSRLQFLSELRRIVDIHYGVWKFAEDYANSTGERVFVYRFSFDGRLGGFKAASQTKDVGAVHGDDLGYLFGDMSANGQPFMTDEWLVRERMVAMWTNFIKFGNPTPRRSADIIPLKWPLFNDADWRRMMDINLNMTWLPLRNLTKRAEYQLWDVIYHCLYALDCTRLYSEYLRKDFEII